jgi:hypothetical protein
MHNSSFPASSGRAFFRSWVQALLPFLRARDAMQHQHHAALPSRHRSCKCSEKYAESHALIFRALLRRHETQ